MMVHARAAAEIQMKKKSNLEGRSCAQDSANTPTGRRPEGVARTT